MENCKKTLPGGAPDAPSKPPRIRECSLSSDCRALLVRPGPPAPVHDDAKTQYNFVSPPGSANPVLMCQQEHCAINYLPENANQLSREGSSDLCDGNIHFRHSTIWLSCEWRRRTRPFSFRSQSELPSVDPFGSKNLSPPTYSSHPNPWSRSTINVAPDCI